MKQKTDPLNLLTCAKWVSQIYPKRSSLLVHSGLLLGHLLMFVSVFGSETFALSASGRNRFVDVVSGALLTDPQYVIQKSQYNESEWLSDSSAYLFLPDLKLSWSQSQIGETFQRQDPKYQTYFITSNLNIFNFGKDYSNYKARHADLAAAGEQLRAYRLQFEKDLGFNLLNTIYLRESLIIQQNQLSYQDNVVKIAKQRYDRGLLALQEVFKVTIDADFTRSQIAKTQEGMVANEQALKRYFDQAPADLQWPKSENDAWPEFLKKTIRSSEHPAYRQKEMELVSATEDYDKARADFIGSLDLSLQWSRTNQYGDYQNQALSILTFSLPIFERGTKLTAKRIAFERMMQAEQKLKLAEYDLQGLQKQAVETLKIRIASLQERKKNLKMSRQILTDNTQRFQQGRLSANELSIDQQRSVQAELQSLEAVKNLNESVLNYCGLQGQELTTCFE